MMFIKNLRFMCHKVLPLVYDDTLSYYELLNKVVYKLNEVIDTSNEIGDEIKDILIDTLNEWKEDGTLALIINEEIFASLKQYYVPEDFGGVGDGSTDCTEAFDSACKAIRDGSIKTLLIPSGKTYLIKNTIGLPEGCNLIGQGKSSVIYYDETHTNFGVALTTGGNNIVISNLCINHKTETYPTPPTGAITGAIGISTIKCVGEHDETLVYERENRRNININNIWTTVGRYCLQIDNGAEISAGVYNTIEDVYVTNIYAPQAMVSVAPRGGGIKNVHYENIVCDILRAGGDSNYFGENITFDNFKCTFIMARANGVKLTNGVVDRSGTCYNESNHMMDLKSGNVLTNIKCIGGTDTTYCIYGRGTENSFKFNNCEFNDFIRFIIRATGSTAPCWFSMCDVSQTGVDDNYMDGGSFGGNFTVPVSGDFYVLPVTE